MNVNLSIVKRGCKIIKFKIGELEFMGIPEFVKYDYTSDSMQIKIITKVCPEIAEKIFKEIQAGEIEVTNGN